MSANDTACSPSLTPSTGWGHAVDPLFVIVGFNGSKLSWLALKKAVRLIRGRVGHLEIVFVAHVPGPAVSSADAVTGLHQVFHELALDIGAEVLASLRGRESRWHFQRRDGSVSRELVTVAREIRREQGAYAGIVIAIGSLAGVPNRLAPSISVKLERQRHFPVLVVHS